MYSLLSGNLAGNSKLYCDNVCEDLLNNEFIVFDASVLPSKMIFFGNFSSFFLFVPSSSLCDLIVGLTVPDI